jgi:hypothetical protein
MMRAYQLMIMRLMLFQQHQSHDHESDHESERAAAREPGRVARGEAGR